MFDDAQTLLQKVVKEKLLRAEGVVGIYRAQGIADDIQLLDTNGEVIGKLHGLRQQVHQFWGCGLMFKCRSTIYNLLQDFFSVVNFMFIIFFFLT